MRKNKLRNIKSIDDVIEALNFASAMAEAYFENEIEHERAMTVGVGLGEYINAVHKYPRETSKKMAMIIYLKHGGKKAIDELEADGELKGDREKVMAMLTLMSAFDHMAKDDPSFIDRVLQEMMEVNKLMEEDK